MVVDGFDFITMQRELVKKLLRSDDVRDLMRREIKKSGSMRAWAETMGVSQQYISKVLSGGREPSETLCRAVGVRSVGMRYERD